MNLLLVLELTENFNIEMNASIFHILALMYNSQMKYKEASTNYLIALRIMEDQLGTKHRNIG